MRNCFRGLNSDQCALAGLVHLLVNMATFSSSYSRAYHVLPLPAWKGIAAAGALKAEAAEAFQRPTTARVDAELGFGGFIHFYLPKHIHNITDLPILQAQLQPADRTPFPHAVIEVHRRA